MAAESYALFVTFGVKPEDYLGLNDRPIDKIKLRAFYLACLSKYQDDTQGEDERRTHNDTMGVTMDPQTAQALIQERREANEF